MEELQGTIVECNTAYAGRRNTTGEHWKAIAEHGFLDIAPCDIMDEDGELSIPVNGGKHLTENFVGAHLQRYDSMLLLSHFKGHAMGGFGGALKNMSIGVASAHGKAHIHGVGVPENLWTADHDSFLGVWPKPTRRLWTIWAGRTCCTSTWPTGCLWTVTATATRRSRKWRIWGSLLPWTRSPGPGLCGCGLPVAGSR